MTVRVDLGRWGRQNLHYIGAWIGMGLVLLVLLIRELGASILILIGPFLPYLFITLKRIREELRQ
jgi:hypothetical protein